MSKESSSRLTQQIEEEDAFRQRASGQRCPHDVTSGNWHLWSPLFATSLVDCPCWILLFNHTPRNTARMRISSDFDHSTQQSLGRHVEVRSSVYGFESNSFFSGNTGAVVMPCGEPMIAKLCSRSCISAIVIHATCAVPEEKVGKFTWVSLSKSWLTYNYLQHS